MAYSLIILDKIACQCFVDWTYADSDVTTGRDGLLKIHLNSAMKKGNLERPMIVLTSITKNEIEQRYCNDERGMCHVSSLVEASEEHDVPPYLSEEDSIVKVSSILKWKKESFCILTGNSLLYDKAKKSGFDVFIIEESSKILAS